MQLAAEVVGGAARSPRSRRHVRTAVFAIASLVAASLWGPVAPAGAEDCAAPLPTDAGFYDAMVRRGDGWLGADLGGHVDLGPNSLIWLFGDTTWGSRHADGSYAEGWRFFANSLGVQTGRCVTVHRPFSHVVPPAPGADLYWPVDGWVVGDDLHLVFTRVELVNNEAMFNFQTTGHDLVRLDLATLQVEYRVGLPQVGWNIGSSVERVGDTLYWWGRSFFHDTGSHRLARSPVTDPLRFEYRTADGWSRDHTRAVPVHRRNQISNARFHRLPDGRYAAVYKDHDVFGTGAVADVADNPWGPWAHMGRIAVAAPRTVGAGEITYAVSMHPGIGWDEGRVLLHWSHNSVSPGMVSNGSVVYRPTFVSVPASVLSDPAGYAGLRARQTYLHAAYQALLGRPPAPARADHWANELGFGLPRSRFATTIARSISGIGVGVDDVHQRVLERPPDPLHRQRLVDLVRSGARLADVEVALLASQEFLLRSGAIPEGYVGRLYETVLGRPAGPSEVDGWVRAMDAGAGRADVARAVVDSVEGRRARVHALYQRHLGRAADPGGLAHSIGVLAGAGELTLSGELVASGEFFARAHAGAG